MPFPLAVTDRIVIPASAVETRFVQIRNVYTKDDPETWEEIRANGHAAIIGVGH